MTPDNYDEFCTALNGCCEAVGKPVMSKAGADIFYLRLIDHELPMVQWGLLEGTKDCKSGFDYTVNRIVAIIEKKLKTSKFREECIVRLNQQEQSAKDLAVYLESDDYKKNQAKAKEVFLACKGLMKNDI